MGKHSKSMFFGALLYISFCLACSAFCAWVVYMVVSWLVTK